MNKNFYRIIFSKARNMFIAVGENSKSQTKAAGESAKIAISNEPQDSTALHQHWVVKSLVASMSVWMSLAPVYAQIQADPAANAANRPVIGVGTNNQGQNVPVVNIQTPVNGVSHNIYKQMDVLSNGVVLNNSRTGAGSVLVGSVGANPFLAKGEARLILNEINSTAATRFEGNLEVAGQRADVIIANPSGINIKGGGFINANKAIFTTGKPQLNADGSLQQFTVDQGKVTVSANTGSSLGLGGNTNNADYVDIYARAVELNAQLHANNEINVITGANTVSANLESIESKSSTAAAPALSLDIKSLGGMYANNIYLMGNEKGLGVSNAGTLQAVNNIVVTNAGKIVHSGTISTSDKKNGLISVATTGTGADADIDVSGSVNSYGLINIDSGNDLNLNAKDITLNYDATTQNSAALIIGAQGNLNLATGTKINNLSTNGDLYVDAKGINLAANSELRSNRGSANINANENLVSNSTARLIAAKDLNLTANKNLKLIGNTLQATSGSINIQSAAEEQLLQVDGGTLYAGKDLNIYGAGDVSLKNLSFNLVNNATRLKNISVYSGKNLTWDNKAKPLPQISGKLQLEAKQGLELSGTAIYAANGIVTQSDTLNLNTLVKSDQGIDLTTHHAMSLAQGTSLSAVTDVNLASLQGSIQAQSLKVNSTTGRASIIAHENVSLNSVQATIAASHADRDEQITDKSVINADQGIVIASAEKGSVEVNSADLTSANGDLQILGQNGVNLDSNTDVVIHGDNGQDTVLTNQLTAKSVSIGTKKGNIDIKNTALVSTVDQLNLNSEAGMLTVNKSTLSSKGNTEIYSKDILTLKNVIANSDQHLAVNSKRTLYLNADYTPATVWDPTAKVSLTSKGVLSLTAAGNQVMQNATLTGGAVLLETENLYVKPGLVFNATGSDLLKNDIELNSLNGDLSIQTSGTSGLTIDPKIMNFSAIGDIELIAKNGLLKLEGYGGTQGNGSEQVVKFNTIGGEISLEGTKVAIQGAQLAAKKDINIISSEGDLLIDGVKSLFVNKTFDSIANVFSKERLEKLEENAPYYSQQFQSDYQNFLFELKNVSSIVEEDIQERNPEFTLLGVTDVNDPLFMEWSYLYKKLTAERLKNFISKYPVKIKQNFEDSYNNDVNRPTALFSLWSLYLSDNPYYLLDPLNSPEILNDLLLNYNFFSSNSSGYDHKESNIESGSGNINILSAKGLSISGGEISAKTGQINLESRGVLDDLYTLTSNSNTAIDPKKMSASMIIDGYTNFYDKGNENDANYSMRTLVNPTVINGEKGVNIKTIGTTANDNLIMQGVGIVSEGDVNIESNKNILFDAAIEQSYDRSTITEKKSSWGGLKKKYITTVSENNDVNAASVDIYGKNISIESKDQNQDVSIDIYSGKFTADGGNISIKAGGNLNFYTVEESSSSNVDITKKSSFAGIKYNTSKTNATRSQVTELPATLKADYIGTKSGFDTRLVGTEFEYLKDATIEAGGKLELIAAKTSITELLKKEKNSVVWQSMQDKGSITETAQLPQFNGPVLPTFKAAGGLSVQVPISEKDQNKIVIRDEILKLANQPGNAYLKEFVNRKDVNWNTVILAQKDWDYKSQGLTGAGAALIVIIVTIVTMGTGTAAAAGAAGAGGAAAGGTTVGLGASMLGTAGITTTAAGAIVPSVLGAMANAAVTSLATQASIGLINNGGDLGATLKELGSKDSIKNLATAVITAGLMDKVGASLNIEFNDLPRLENFANNFIQGVGSNIISNSIQGESLSDTLEKALIAGISSSLQGEFAQNIKQLEDVNYVLHKIAHAVAGCVVGALQKSCEAGAIGAAVGEVVAGQLNDGSKILTIAEKEKIINQSKLIAGVVAAYAGYDVDVAAMSADMAVRNNNTHEAVVMAELDALWIDSGYDKEKYYVGVEKIAERDGLALGILTSWMTLGTGASVFSAFISPSWKELPKFKQNYVNDYMTQFGKGEDGAIKLLAHIQKNGVPKDIDRKAFSAYQKQILNIGGNKAKTSNSKVFQTRVEILKKVLGEK
ncbi:two-partner secretion domain-containing protein [Acinetobacter sp. ANC 3781]